MPPLARAFHNPVEAAWNTQRRSAHPVGCFTEKVRLRKPLEEYPFTRTYVKASEEPQPQPGARQSPFWRAAERTRADPAWRYREIATDHMILVNRPDEFVCLMLELT